MKRLIYIKPMSADKRFIITSRLNKAKHDVMTYGEYNTINEVHELQRQGHTIIQIADYIGLVYVIGDVSDVLSR